MIVSMRQDATREQIEHVFERILDSLAQTGGTRGHCSRVGDCEFLYPVVFFPESAICPSSAAGQADRVLSGDSNNNQVIRM